MRLEKKNPLRWRLSYAATLARKVNNIVPGGRSYRWPWIHANMFICIFMLHVFAYGDCIECLRCEWDTKREEYVSQNAIALWRRLARWNSPEWDIFKRRLRGKRERGFYAFRLLSFRSCAGYTYGLSQAPWFYGYCGLDTVWKYAHNHWIFYKGNGSVNWMNFPKRL